MTQEELIRRVDNVLALGEEVNHAYQNAEHGAPGQLIHHYRTSGLGLLLSTVGKDHPYYTSFMSASQGLNQSSANGVLETLRADIDAGWLMTTRGLIAGELFGDFLQMADHLLDEKYHVASAVIAGSALEAHLHRLCDKHDVKRLDAKGKHRQAASLNEDLKKAGAYELVEQQHVTAWLAIRNHAAHGETEKVEPGTVRLMIAGIRHFMMMRPT